MSDHAERECEALFGSPYERIEELERQLAAAVAERDRLTAEQDEARSRRDAAEAESAHGKATLAWWTERAGLMERQRDKALTDLREAERERDEMAAALPATFYAGLGLLSRVKMLVKHWNRLVVVNQELEDQLSAKDQQLAELAATLVRARGMIQAQRLLDWTDLDQDQIIRGQENVTRQIDTWLRELDDPSAILSAYLRREAGPLLKALDYMLTLWSEIHGDSEDLDKHQLGIHLAEKALNRWRSQHPEPPESGGDAT